ncbi:MAG TPA: TetR/AcrR family transcriptional regulator [Caulobacteraceae bacterium]|nr:TetR/AcrR family transcriptional regulator [Caulobacteraceae bacterium]
MEQTAIVQRAGGRPDQQGLAELELRLIETAAKLFTQQGYDATSIDQIAAEAGIGKPTIYRRYPTKDHLFKAVLTEHLFKRFVEAWARQTEILAKEAEVSTGSALEALKQICRITLELILDPDAVSLYRLVIAEERRSTLSEKDLENSCLVFEGVIYRQIEAAQEAGELPPRLSPYAAHALMAMLVGWAHKQTLLLGAVVSAEERDAFFDCAWSLFLNGVKA